MKRGIWQHGLFDSYLEYLEIFDGVKCAVRGCKHKAAKGRKICYKHKQKKYRKKYPINDAYYHLKSNAKRRGKVFDLTFEQFKEFATQTAYIDKRGRRGTCLSIDRIDNTLGYTITNIRPLTVSANSSKHDCPF